MKGRIRPWGADLAPALAALSGDLALILVGPGPLAFHASAPALEQVARIQEASELWGGSYEFHLWSESVEYRWDHGSGVELSVAEEGDHELVERSVLLAREAHQAPGMGALLAHAPEGRLRVREFRQNGSPIDLKLEALA